MDMLADAIRDKALNPLLKEYAVDNLNVFGICIGGLLISYLINREQKKDKDFAKKFNKIAYYGSPMLGARDLGILRSFSKFYAAMKPCRPALDNTGIILSLESLTVKHRFSAFIGEPWTVCKGYCIILSCYLQQGNGWLKYHNNFDA